MSILVTPHNENDEKKLIAFLDSMKYDYRPDFHTEDMEDFEAFLEQYNNEIDEAEIDSGNYLEQDEVEKIFAERRIKLNFNQMEQPH